MSETNRTMVCPKCGAENYSWRSHCQTCNTPLHEEDTNTVKVSRFGALEWGALITGLIGSGVLISLVWLFFAIFKGSIPDVGLVFMLGIGLFGIGGIAIAWKWPLIAGVLLIVESLWPIGLLVWFFDFWGLLLLTPGLLLPLASGVLFILSWREGQRHPDNRVGNF